MSAPPPRRILVRLPAWVGDVVMATPALRQLGEAFPDAEITVLGKRHYADLVEDLDYVHAYLPDVGRKASEVWRQSRELKRAGFDVAVLLGESERVAIAPALARIPRRFGYGHGAARRILLTDPIPRPRDESGELLNFSMIERYLAVVRVAAKAFRVEVRQGTPAAGTMDVPIHDGARAAVAQRLADAGCDGPTVTVIAGAAYGDAKLWPAEHFAAACDALAERRGLRAVLGPGPGEEPVAARVAAAAQHPVTVLQDPPLTLMELAALIERSDVVLSNDTGPRSIAVALGRPVVSMLGPTDDAHTRHHLDQQRVLMADVDCRPCHLKTCPIDHRCMTRIPATDAVRAAEALLDANGGAR